MTSTLDVWIDGENLGMDLISWSQDIEIDSERMKHDPWYFFMINRHITQALQYLAKEVELIGNIRTPMDGCIFDAGEAPRTTSDQPGESTSPWAVH